MCKTFSSLLVLSLLFPAAAGADDQTQAKAILDQAIKAHGGEAVLGKFVGMRDKTKGTSYDGDKQTPINVVSFSQGIGKSRAIVDCDGASIMVVDGKKGWGKEGDHPTDELNADGLQSLLETNYVSWVTTVFVPLREKGFRLSSLEDITVDGRKADGIEVTHEKHKPLKLYFDKETHLLVKYQRESADVESEKVQNEETVFSDYADFQGTKQARRMVTSEDGVKASDVKLVEFELLEKPLDDKLFAKP